MKAIRVTLCPPPCEPECPEVEITEQGVTIGEDGNRVRLTHAQWNDLVSRIGNGELPPVP